jgi:hypothetical protein
MGLITTCLDEMGITVLYTQPCLPILEPLSEYLTHHFYHGIDKPNKKVSIRLLKLLWLHMN